MPRPLDPRILDRAAALFARRGPEATSVQLERRPEAERELVRSRS